MDDRRTVIKSEVRAVFIHLGESPAEHLWLNIKRHLKLFPQIPVHLIYSSSRHERRIPRGCDRFYLDINTLDPKLTRSRDIIFRRGFWSHTLSRLFSLPILHEQFPSDSLLHIESDVLLLPDFPWNDFRSQGTMGWQQFNFERDVASLLFVPNLNFSRILSELLNQSLARNPSHTDMTILREIRRENPKVVDYLPIVDSGISAILNPHFQNTQQILRESQNSVFFGKGIFDSAAIGMWLLGHDPRNTYGKFLLHDTGIMDTGQTPIDPKNLEYELTSSGHLKVFDKSDINKKTSLWSLHVHSKEKKLFSISWVKRLDYYISLANSNPDLIKGFRLKSVFSMFIDNLWTGTPHRFFFGFPIVHRFRSRLLKLVGRSPYA